MATNITQESCPNTWSSTADDIIYTFTFNGYAIDSVTNNGGYAKINLFYDFDVLPIIGDQIYINGSVYSGVFKILTVTGTSSVTINTPYVSSITSNLYNCYHLRIPTFELWSGIPTYINETKLTEINPSYVFEDTFPKIKINLSEFCRNSFTIEFFNTPNEIDTSIFNGFKLVYDGVTTTGAGWLDESLVVNSTLTNAELQFKYVSGDSGFFLCDTDKPIIYEKGVTFLTYISTFVSGGFPILYKYINGNKQ